MGEGDDLLVRERAAAAGRAAGEAFERKLREREARARVELLTHAVLRPDGSPPPVTSPGPWGRDEAELRRQLDHFASFHHAVLHSRSWKVLQRLRSLFGRAW